MNLFSTDFEKSLSVIFEKILKEKLSQLSPQLETLSIPNDDYLSKNQAKNFLGISLSCLNNYLRSGKIKKHRIGSKVLIKRADLIKAVSPIN